jgi:hypothetical protein
MKEKVWIQKGNEFYISDTYDVQKLEPAIYSVKYNQLLGYYLNKEKEKFDFKYKVYGLESNFINRVCKTFENQNKNLGVLFYGIKGTGKSVTAKLISNKLNLPVICIDDSASEENNDAETFINSIPQDIIIFIDEYEKKYEYHNDNLLSIMDGSATSSHKRLFLLTTNRIHINDNMMGRPGRLRYIKSYSSIEESLQREIIKDLLKDQSKTDELIEFCKTLSIITVDILKSIIDEMNLFNESPEDFYTIFNIKKSSFKYNLYELINGKKELLFSNCTSNIDELVYSFVLSNDRYDRDFYVNETRIGQVIGSINSNTVKVLLDEEEEDSDPVPFQFIKKSKLKNKKRTPKTSNNYKIITFETVK